METIVDEKLIFELDPFSVKVNKDLPRQRKDVGEINKMVDSIKKFGQMQPIVINRDDELIAGGRRLAACMLGGFKVRCCYKDTVDPLVMREMELEENIQRKALTASEEVLAVSELVELKQSIYGVKVQNKEGGFSHQDAADILGRSRTSIVEDIQLAEAIKAFPDLAACKTKSEIKSAVKGMQRVKDSVEALVKYEEIIKRSEEFVLVNKDAQAHMKGMPENSVDLLLTDPPYGIDIHENAMTVGGETGGASTTTSVKYDDSAENAISLYKDLAVESFRFTKPTAHAFVFLAPSHFWTVKELFNAAGWKCSERPLIWVKPHQGQNNCPEYWFSSSYEMILFARKPDSRLAIQGKADYIQCDLVLPSEKIHQAEKPVNLLKELISRACLPGCYVYDPFMGSAAVIESAVSMKMLALGCELDPSIYAMAVTRMTKVGEKK